MSDSDNIEPLLPDVTVPVNDLIQGAADVHKKGEFKTAEALYRKILKFHPKNADALHLLGFLAHQVGCGEEGLELIKEAKRHKASRGCVSPLFGT